MCTKMLLSAFNAGRLGGAMYEQIISTCKMVTDLRKTKCVCTWTSERAYVSCVHVSV